MDTPPHIPLCDISAQTDAVRGELLAAIGDVLASGQFILGPAVEGFERELADYCDSPFAVGCSSGTDALTLALMALGVGPGDEVITSPFTFVATASAVSRLGATPVFVDIEPQSLTLDPDRLAAARTSRTRAIIPVHLFGQTADMDPIVHFARRFGLAVVEDSAQSIGATYRGRKAGSIGDVGCLSFFPSKNLGAAGDAGAVVTADGVLAERMRQLRVHGARSKYRHEIVGGNFRLDAMQAAILRVKLRHLNHWNTRRRELAASYRALIAASSSASRVVVAAEAPDRRHVYNQFVVRVPNRDLVTAALGMRGIATAVYYPIPLHLQQCFRALGYERGDCPVAEQIADDVCALPMYPELTELQQVTVVDALAAALATPWSSVASDDVTLPQP